MTGQEVQRWADEAMFSAAPMQVDRTEDGMIIPKVTLLWMTPDPLGAIAAMCRMYKGEVTYDLGSITDDERRDYLVQVQKTHLQAPLEAVKLHFFIEGVTRSFTHQMVRQRTAVYAQESMRFAVKEEAFTEITSLPPSLAGTYSVVGENLLPSSDKKQRWREAWDECVDTIDRTYRYLVNDGMPAEDARGLVHHAITTRLHYSTDLRNLKNTLGNRLCTQAQFEWRLVAMGIVKAIKHAAHKPNGPLQWAVNDGTAWQFPALAESALFRPVCYELGHCPFTASFDRACSIRDRVEAFAKQGVPSSEWATTHPVGFVKGIDHSEWLMDPAAARNTSGGGGHE